MNQEAEKNSNLFQRTKEGNVKQKNNKEAKPKYFHRASVIERPKQILLKPLSSILLKTIDKRNENQK